MSFSAQETKVKSTVAALRKLGVKGRIRKSLLADGTIRLHLPLMKDVALGLDKELRALGTNALGNIDIALPAATQEEGAEKDLLTLAQAQVLQAIKVGAKRLPFNVGEAQTQVRSDGTMVVRFKPMHASDAAKLAKVGVGGRLCSFSSRSQMAEFLVAPDGTAGQDQQVPVLVPADPKVEMAPKGPMMVLDMAHRWSHGSLSVLKALLVQAGLKVGAPSYPYDNLRTSNKPDQIAKALTSLGWYKLKGPQFKDSDQWVRADQSWVLRVYNKIIKVEGAWLVPVPVHGIKVEAPGSDQPMLAHASACVLAESLKAAGWHALANKKKEVYELDAPASKVLGLPGLGNSKIIVTDFDYDYKGVVFTIILDAENAITQIPAFK